MAFSGHTRLKSKQSVLRKQNSCVESNNYEFQDRNRFKLQKQLSIDSSKPKLFDINNQQYWINNVNEQSTGLRVNGKPPLHNKVIRKREPPTISDNDISTSEPASKDDRINLSIVLSHNTPVADAENSECESSCELHGNNHLIQKTTDNSNNYRNQNATDKRSQFRTSRKSMSKERVKPPLQRAMSAPIRSFDESNSKNMSKRKLRRKKIQVKEKYEDVHSTILEQSQEISDNNLDLNPNEKLTVKRNGQMPRARSAIASHDIVTLVSLLSSGGSDSDHEDESSETSSNAKQPLYAPMLSKVGKSGINISISFQDNELNEFVNSAKDLTSIYRRGSIAPLAARIYAKRPPTAPPGSIMQRNFDTSDIVMTTSTPVNDCESEQTVKREKPIEETLDQPYPDFVTTVKEKECWRLFRKMDKKGVAVSYDTILRGMLTPTELRSFEKKREINEKSMGEKEVE